ncbi:MAG: hypothetical protein ACOC9Y_06240 [Chloroflexota bacterium]
MRVGIVGPCASGKSTVARLLQEHGADAYAVAQEHSGVPDLWRRKDPDALIYLNASLDTIRERRGNPQWPGWILDLQQERLRPARQQADLIVETDNVSPEAIVDRILSTLGSS